MTAVFRLSNTGKQFGSRQVLQIDQLEIEEGRIYSILGPNGAGKTTLMRIIALLMKNDSGRLQVLGENVNWGKSQVLRLRRQMAMVTQTAYMFEGSVYDNVAYGLKVRKLPLKEQQARVQESLSILGMNDFISYPARKLSGGERQKVAIARALAVAPRVLLLDEPTSNISAPNAMDIEHYIRFINEQYGTTVIMITHNLFQARRLADHIFLLWDGYLLEQGTPDKMFTQASDPRAKSFLQGETFF